MRVADEGSPLTDPERFGRLSARERQVLGMAAAGFLDKQIGSELGISLNTLRTYWTRIREKVGEGPRTALAVAYVTAEAPDPYEPMDSLVDGGWLYDIEMGTILASDAVNEFYGFEPGIPHPIAEYLALTHPEDKEGSRKAAKEVVDGVIDNAHITYRVVKDGTVYDIHTLMRGIRDASGKVVKVMGYRTSPSDCRASKGPESIDWDWTVDMKSWQYRRLFTDAQVAGEKGEFIDLDEVLKLFHPEDSARLRAILHNIRFDGTDAFSYRMRILEASGVGEAGAFVKVERDESGEAVLLYGRRNVMRDLRTPAVDSVQVGFWSRDLRTNVYVGDEALCRIFRVDQSDPDIREKVLRRMHPDDQERARRFVSDAIAAGKSSDRATHRMRFEEDGSEIWAATDLRIEYDETGAVRAYGTVLTFV